MKIEIIKLNFNKTRNGNTDLNDEKNLENLFKWVFPVIENNEGWGTGDLTKESFLKNREKYQDMIDASTWNNVQVFLHKSEPVALLEYSKSKIANYNKERHRFLNRLLIGKDNLDEFERLIGRKVESNLLVRIKDFLQAREFYTSTGIAVRPDLQGKKTGIVEEVYKTIGNNAVFFGWTSNPVIVRLRRKLFKNTLFFPLFRESPNKEEEVAVCLYVYADRLGMASSNKANQELGVMYSRHFVENRGVEYLKLAAVMCKQRKITALDKKRLDYVLKKKSCAAAIVSWN